MIERCPEWCGKKCKFSPIVLEGFINHHESRNTFSLLFFFLFCRWSWVRFDAHLEWLIISTDSSSWQREVPGMKEQTGANVTVIYSCEPKGNMNKSEKQLQRYRSAWFPSMKLIPSPILPPDVKHQHCNVTQSDFANTTRQFNIKQKTTTVGYNIFDVVKAHMF